MPTRLVIAAVCLLVLGVAACRAALTAVRERRWMGSAVRGLTGLLLVALAALAGAITVGLREYDALTLEVPAATVRTEPLGPHRFRATITLLPDKRLAMYELAGDAFYMDAHILKWHPWVNLLGLHTSYELSRPPLVDLFWIAKRGLLGPLVDAEYGSAAFVAGTAPADYEVRVSTTGLLMRPILHSTPPD